jgi:hypothetical protein
VKFTPQREGVYIVKAVSEKEATAETTITVYPREAPPVENHQR